MKVYVVSAFLDPQTDHPIGHSRVIGVFFNRKEARNAVERALGFRLRWGRDDKYFSSEIISEVPGIQWVDIRAWRVGNRALKREVKRHLRSGKNAAKRQKKAAKIEHRWLVDSSELADQVRQAVAKNAASAVDEYLLGERR